MGIPPQIELGVLGWADSLIIMVLGLVVFGPRKLPQIGRQIGKLMYEFRKASNDFKFQMEEEMRASEEADRRKKQEEERLRAEALRAQSGTPALPAPVEPGSPYREDAVYPPAAPPEEKQAEDSAPLIQPPSTGEQVMAARPATPHAGDEVAPAANGNVLIGHGSENGVGPTQEPVEPVVAAADSGQAANSPVTEDAHPETEQAAHHG
jgi:sec-independent protein translocase protein TatB